MSIEKNIERIANALEALVEMKRQQPLDFTELKGAVEQTVKEVEDKPRATKTKADKPAKETKVEKPEPQQEDKVEESPAPSVEDVRKVATDLVKGGGKPQLGAILQELGADNLSSIAPADRSKALELIQAATAKL